MLEIEDSLARELDAGGTLVTPSPQRGAALQLAYAGRQLALGRTAWATPDVRALTAFLEGQASRARDAGERLPRPLLAPEEWWLWHEATRAALEESGLEGRTVPLEPLRRAARTLTEWQIPARVLTGSPRGESRLLARVLERLEGRCRALDASLSHHLFSLLEPLAPRQPVTFVGFTGCTPARAGLLSAWRGRGASVREAAGESVAARTSILEAGEPAEELEQAAHWCRAQLASDPRRRLLVVVADLGQRRDELTRTFTQVLAPAAAAAASAEPAALLLESGRPLADFALVRHALASLKLLTGELEPAELSAWLRAAFWRAPPACERARLDLALRREAVLPVSAAALSDALARVPAGLAPIAAALHSRIAAALRALELGGGPAPLHLWCVRLGRALEALGWPGERALSSLEQQLQAGLAEVFQDCASLGAHIGAAPAARAVSLLEALSARAPFAPASGEPAVTVTASLSDPVARYDGIWITGLHADTWPPPVRVDPFIPLWAQQQAGIPAASAAGMLAQARTLQRLWQRRTAELVVSWSRHGAERTHSPAPLLAELPGLAPLGAADVSASLLAQVRASRRTETTLDVRGAAWAGGRRLPAGTRLLELESRCAFRAHAELRLAAAPLESARPGIEPRERGRLLHRSLEYLWDALVSSAELRARQQGGALDALVGECVRRAAQRELGPSAEEGRAAARRREERRTVRLLGELLELELTRSPFRSLAREARRTVALAGAELEVRIDRIDVLEDGSLAIIDYKSGKPVKLDWLGARLLQPQLLVYEAAAGGAVSTLAAVHLVPGQIGYRGFADRTGRLPNLATVDAATPWTTQLAGWRAALERLAADFLAGVAVLNPAPQACRTCHLHALCRIADAPDVPETGPDADAEPLDE